MSDPQDPEFGRRNRTLSFLVDAAIMLRKQGDAARAEKLLTEHQVAPAVSTRVLAADGKHRPVKLKKRA